MLTIFKVCVLEQEKYVHPCREEHLLRGGAVKEGVRLGIVCVKSSAVSMIFLETSHVFG